LRSVIARYEVSAADPNAADPSSAAVLLRFDQPFPGHNNTQVAFGPGDGYLYIGTGDGGNHDPDCGSQEDDGFHGKILRVDVDRNAQHPPFYGIPPDNPHADPADGVLEEIWSRGLRHPWRFSFDPVTRDLYIADVGEFEREEVIRQPAESRGGENYGWSVMEGTLCRDPDILGGACPAGTPSCFDPAYTGPTFEYPHDDEDCAITGGFVYRGGTIPGLRGRYVFGDVCSKLIWMLDETSPGVLSRTQIADGSFNPAFFGLTSFGEDAAGELYATLGDDVYRLVFAGIPVEVDVHRSKAQQRRRDSAEIILVTIFGSASFEVRDLDLDSIAFGPDAAPPLHHPAGWRRRRPHRWDLNHDGFEDLLLRFRAHEAGLAPGDRHACVWGEGDAGFFGGCTALRVRPPECGKGFELAFLVPALAWLRTRGRVSRSRRAAPLR
ncbi:MAG: PQQ-dependent sugar dehydrogenase, partial [Myxococcota bacterium]